MSDQMDPGDLAPDELHIELLPFDIPRWEFHGTLAQLRAEGLIPANVEPPSGELGVSWEAGRIRYCLARYRRPRQRGPKRVWVNGDWWVLSGALIGADILDIRARRLAAELRQINWQRSRAGQVEWFRNFQAFDRAQTDHAFQTFKELVPGLSDCRRSQPAARSTSRKGA